MTRTPAARVTIKGAIGMLLGIAGTVYLIAGHARAQPPAAGQQQPPAPPPSEQINVEQTISFPYDI